MRQNLITLIKNCIIFEYDLSNTIKNIPKSVLTTSKDSCYSAKNQRDFIEVIYNLIIDYSFDEFEFNEIDFEKMLTIAFQERIRFRPSDKFETQVKYGFFGEVLLYAILKLFFDANTIISKGTLYDPLSNSESKGYDSYHLVDKGNEVELWFGETKFYTKYTSAINDALNKLNFSLSDNYLSQNFVVFRKHKEKLNTDNRKIKEILDQWHVDPNINLLEELQKRSISLVHPILIISEMNKKGYDYSIKKIINYINKNHQNKNITLSIPYKLFFILIPVSDVKQIKKEVLKWISIKQPPLS